MNVVNNSQSGAKLALLTPESGWHYLANTEVNTHGDANFTGRTFTSNKHIELKILSDAFKMRGYSENLVL